MYDTHSPAEWAAYGFLGLVPVGLLLLALAFADADPGYYKAAAFDAALTAAALLILLSLTAPEGAR